MAPRSPGPVGAAIEQAAAEASRFVAKGAEIASGVAGRPRTELTPPIAGEEDITRLLGELLGEVQDRTREGRLATSYTESQGVDVMSGLVRGAAMAAGVALTLAEQFGFSSLTDVVRNAGRQEVSVEHIDLGQVAAGDIARGSVVIENVTSAEVGPVRPVATSLLGPLGRSNTDEPSYIAFQDVIFSPRSIPVLGPRDAERVGITFAVPRETRPGQYVGLMKTLPLTQTAALLQIEVLNQ
ncbi:MAG: hypothetical protein AAGD18_24495 [Actinomycetota bacterium]